MSAGEHSQKPHVGISIVVLIFDQQFHLLAYTGQLDWGRQRQDGVGGTDSVVMWQSYVI